jgi:hypothetical protein
MDRPLPEHFFKYTTRSTAEIVLKTRALRWSTPALLNDPYDLQFDLHVELDADTLRKKTLDKMWNAWYGADPYVPSPDNIMGMVISAFRKQFPKLTRAEFDNEFGSASDEGLHNIITNLPEKHQAFRAIASMTKILCQSEVPDSLLMWAYYAEQHKGVVLRFKPSVELDSAWLAAKPVQYSETMPRLFDEEILADLAAGLVSLHSKDVVERLVYSKAAAWAHERERRLSLGLGREHGTPFEDVKFHERELDAVILGCVMPQEDRSRLIELAQTKYPHAEILQACKHDREFKLILEEVI